MAAPRIIKKYPNRRLYDTETSAYITLAEVKEQIRSSLAEAGGMRRYLDTLHKQTYVSVRPEAIDLTPLPAAPAAPAR